jgi:hypothetical protein
VFKDAIFELRTENGEPKAIVDFQRSAGIEYLSYRSNKIALKNRKEHDGFYKTG